MPIVANGPAAPAGTAVGLGTPVWVGSIVATPMEVREDSRCPMNARCIRAGEAVVLTRIDGTGWRETVPLTLSEPYATHGTTLTLTSVMPHQLAGSTVPSADYRFTFEGTD